MSKAPASKIDIKRVGSSLGLNFAGPISEETTFPTIPDDSTITEIKLNLGKLTLVNSWGVRLWMKWLWDLDVRFATAQITLEQCPPAMVKQILVVERFVPERTRVSSILLPYYCEACDKDQVSQLRADDLILKKTPDRVAKALGTKDCPLCGGVMDIDIMPDRFLGIFNLKK